MNRTLLDVAKALVGDYLTRRSLAKYHTGEWRKAPLFARYLDHCRTSCPVPESSKPRISAAAEQFDHDGVTSYWDEESEMLATRIMSKLTSLEANSDTVWTGSVENIKNYDGDVYGDFVEIEDLFRNSLGDLVRQIFRTEFKIYFGVMLRSERTQALPTASQLWHHDGGPGTCINVMFYLHHTTPESGALEVLPWDFSRDILDRHRPAVRRKLAGLADKGASLSRSELRDLSCDHAAENIAAHCRDRPIKPLGKAGLCVLFRNNIIHRGGFPDEGHVRYACIFHCYPSDCPPDFERYRREGRPKQGSAPLDPTDPF